MFNVKITDVAKGEIDSICNYLENNLGSKQAKENFVSKLNKQISILKELPELYSISKRPEISKFDGRVAPVNNYALIYIIEDDDVIILHVFHSSQDYGRMV